MTDEEEQRRNRRNGGRGGGEDYDGGVGGGEDGGEGGGGGEEEERQVVEKATTAAVVVVEEKTRRRRRRRTRRRRRLEDNALPVHSTAHILIIKLATLRAFFFGGWGGGRGGAGGGRGGGALGRGGGCQAHGEQQTCCSKHCRADRGEEKEEDQEAVRTGQPTGEKKGGQRTSTLLGSSFPQQGTIVFRASLGVHGRGYYIPRDTVVPEDHNEQDK